MQSSAPVSCLFLQAKDGIRDADVTGVQTCALPISQRDLIAALHPADLTVRPQILQEEQNPEYYAIIKAFERLTGVGGVLNTSFNLHGHPIVLGPKEALYTFENSELDALVLSNYIISR